VRLRDIDQRRLFWVKLAVMTATDASKSADDIDWPQFDWDSLRAELESWLQTLSPTTTDQYIHPVTDWLRLVFVARPRNETLRGVRRWPSLTHAEPPPPPPLQLADGDTADFRDLTLAQVQDFASGRARLAIELPSHQTAWTVLVQTMKATGATSTSAMNKLELEVHAAMLGLVEGPQGELGDFDEGWQAVNRQTFPIQDDPRDQGPEQR
jgi:hypothetical protein